MTLTVARVPGITFRELATDADWWAVRDLLIRTFRDVPVGWNWEIRRWDGWRFHSPTLGLSPLMRRGIGLWEADGRLVGAAHCEDGGDVFLDLDPDFRRLQGDMLDWAEGRLAKPCEGGRTLQTYVYDYDISRRTLVAERGYTMLEAGGWMRQVRFGNWAIPDELLAEPYVLATTSAATAFGDAERMATLLNAAFRRTQHNAAEYLTFMANSPSFSHDLNLVALAPDGSFAAHVGLTAEPSSRSGVFEPVCTHPDHVRKGLARGLMLEGMRRLRDLGTLTACVDTGDMGPANALYRAVGFTEEYRGHWWEKTWTQSSSDARPGSSPSTSAAT